MNSKKGLGDSDAFSEYVVTIKRCFENDISDIFSKVLIDLISDGRGGVAFLKDQGDGKNSSYGNKNISMLLGSHFDKYLNDLPKFKKFKIPWKLSKINFEGGEVEVCCKSLETFAKMLRGRLHIKLSADVDVIRMIILFLHSYFSTDRYKCCKFCFRKIILYTACWHHSSDMDNHYLTTLKVFDYISDDKKKIINKWKIKRTIYGDAISIIEPFEGAINYIREFGSRGNGLPNLRVDKDISVLLVNLFGLPWSQSSGYIEVLMEQEFPFVAIKLKGATEGVDSFPQYIKKVYSKDFLDNRYDASYNPLWFFITITMAEIWFEAEHESSISVDGREKNTRERDDEIKRLKLQGKTLSEIGELVGLKRTQVGKILNEFKKNVPDS